MIRLGDIGSAAIGLTYSPSAVADGGTLVLRSSNIQNEQLVFRDDVFVEMDVPLSSRVQPGDILVCARNGSRPLIGKSVLLDHRVEGMAFGAFMALFRSKFNNYVIHQFRSNGMRRQIEMHLGATINQITNSSLLSFEIPFPSSEKERDLIAEALSDADAAIESLDALIAKKRDVKQATMQQLLTGRIRMPGFTVDWKKTELRSVLKFQVGFPFSSQSFAPNGIGIRLIRNADLKSASSAVSIVGAYPEEFAVQSGDLLIGMDGDFAPIIWKGGFALLNQRVGRVICGPEMNKGYARYELARHLKEIEIRTGATTVKHLSHDDVASIVLKLPPLKEQEAIAEALTVIDDELEALTEQVSKLRMVKEGMMQDLLTGKVRLV